VNRPRRILGMLWVAVLIGVLAAGCGEKITIPESEGLFSVNSYVEAATYTYDDDPRQVLVLRGSLYVITATRLMKRDRTYGGVDSALGFHDPRALCGGIGDSLIYVWDQGTGTVSWYTTRDLAERGHALLPHVQRVVGMATSPAGVEQLAPEGALTFLYFADPDSGVVHRYAYTADEQLLEYGVLTDDRGQGVRSVQAVAGLARDSEDSLLVCDRDSLRHWVIRFDARPDTADADLRGRAARFRIPECLPAPAAAFVLGDAPDCGDDDWSGGPGTADGAFDQPLAVAVDGTGRIFVADHGNDRAQIFDADGRFLLRFGDEETMPAPVSVATVDIPYGSGGDAIHYGAYVYVVSDGVVRRFISGERYLFENREPPPPP